MVTLRCTQKLLRRLGVEPRSAGMPTTVLGDWYGTLIVARPAHLVLSVSEVTLLPVVFAAAPLSGLVPRFRDAVGGVLRALRVADDALDREMLEMADVTVSATSNRRVLGSMNDFLRMLTYELEMGPSLPGASLRLPEAPCGPIGMESPRRATVRAFAG